MKKYLLTIFCSVLFFIGAKAQAYHPMFLDSGKWNIYYSSYNQGWPFNGLPQNIETTFSFRIAQPDTIINSVHYRKSNTNQCFREDSSNRKIYVLDTTDKLLYDFSLSVGDSFLIHNGNMNGWFHVSKVDSVLTLKGVRKRIIINVVNHQSTTVDTCQLTWIEQVGCTFGFDYRNDLHYYFIADAGARQLLCSYSNNQQVYKNISFNQCYINNVGINETINPVSISIFPNPTSSSFIITKTTNENLQMHVYNLIGQNVLNVSLKENQTTVERNNLPSGAYLFSIASHNGKMLQNGKIIFE